MMSYWNHTDIGQFITLHSLYTFKDFCKLTARKRICNGTMEIRIFHVPDPMEYQPYEYTRVNHAKYVSSESTVYISTSNWSWDYFYNTAGVSFVATHPEMVRTTTGVFERDWNSPYAEDLSVYLKRFHLI